VNKKRLLIALAVVAVMLVGGITAGTALQIEQPVSATIKVEALGNSPSFDLIDNPDDTKAGGKTGNILADDTYDMNFGPTGAGVTFGRNQTVFVGSSSDPIFTLQNNYAKNLLVKWKFVGGDVPDPAKATATYLNFLSYPSDSGDHGFLNVYITGTSVSAPGWHMLPPSASRAYYFQYQSHGLTAQPAASWTVNLKLIAEENEQPLLAWAQKKLSPNDAMFDDVNEVVYHMRADGSEVDVIAFADWDHDAWLASWTTD
jgi:hypothetical protein